MSYCVHPLANPEYSLLVEWLGSGKLRMPIPLNSRGSCHSTGCQIQTSSLILQAETGGTYGLGFLFRPRNEPGARPEDGVTRYYSDATQGPVPLMLQGGRKVWKQWEDAGDLKRT